MDDWFILLLIAIFGYLGYYVGLVRGSNRALAVSMAQEWQTRAEDRLKHSLSDFEKGRMTGQSECARQLRLAYHITDLDRFIDHG